MVKIFLEGHGCSASMADTEILGGLISQSGYEMVDSEQQADLSVLVTCSVKGVTEQRMLSRIRELTAANGNRVVVAGCLPKADRAVIDRIHPQLSMIGPSNLHRIVPVIESTLQNKPLSQLSSERLVKLGLPRTRINEVVGIVEICSGCLSSCTFCQVKLVKGVVSSYPEEEILSEVRLLVSQGAKEIWLTSTDNAAYGRDAKSSLPRLLRRVCELPGDFKVRVGMMNPLLTKRMEAEMIECFENEKVFKFLHIPVQSGSDRILALMKRGYTAEAFYSMVDSFRHAFPDLTLATDIIVGFPSETDSEFLETTQLIKRIRPDVVNLSRFAPRGGTRAAEMEWQIPPSLSKARSTEMTGLIKQISKERNLQWMNWKGEVLIDERVKGAFVGRNFAYKPCLIKSEQDQLLGARLRVRVSGATASTLRCDIEDFSRC